jgi:hypothetical protein
LDYLIQNNALMQLAQRAGYRVVAISSDYFATERWDRPEVCLCTRYGLDEVEQSAIAKTPLAALPLDRPTYGAHRRKVIGSLTATERSTSPYGPTFVFVHLIVPHPPFVFGPNGSPRRPPDGRTFNFGDGEHFLGSKNEYMRGYRDQVGFVTAQLTKLVGLLLSRPGTPPVIVIHGDHGPGSMMFWNNPQNTNMRERMSIFAAYYFPESGAKFYPSISPLNGARLLATHYLKTPLPMLADKAFFSTWNEPYQFIPVEIEIAQSIGKKSDTRQPPTSR